MSRADKSCIVNTSSYLFYSHVCQACDRLAPKLQICHLFVLFCFTPCSASSVRLSANFKNTTQMQLMNKHLNTEASCTVCEVILCCNISMSVWNESKSLCPVAKCDHRYRFWMMGADEDAIMTVVTDLSDPKSLILRTVTWLGYKMTHTHTQQRGHSKLQEHVSSMDGSCVMMCQLSWTCSMNKAISFNYNTSARWAETRRINRFVHVMHCRCR